MWPAVKQRILISIFQSNSSASAIAISGTDVYVAGYEGNFAKYWKNGIGVSLSDGTMATAIAISGADVYVAGWEDQPYTAKYWKNGIAVSLKNKDGSEGYFANSIFVVEK